MTMSDIMVVSGHGYCARAIKKSLGLVQSSWNIGTTDDLLADLLPACDAIIFDPEGPLRAGDGPRVLASEAARRVLTHRYKGITIVSLTVSDPALLSSCFSQLLTMGEINVKKYSSLAQILHDLKNRLGMKEQVDTEEIEHLLRLVELQGIGRKYWELKALWDEGKVSQAADYARSWYDRSSGAEGISSVPGHAPFSAKANEGHSTPIQAHIVFVDDQENWLARFEHLTEEFNRQQTRFVFEPHVFGDPKRAVDFVLHSRCGVQAIVLDFQLEQEGEPGTTARELARDIRMARPELPIFGLTGGLQPPNTSEDGMRFVPFDWDVDLVFYKHDEAEFHELLLSIAHSINKRSCAPFFSSLRDYAAQPNVVFHALPLSRAKSIAGSQWTRDFAEFYGEGYFAGETSSTMAPLDSLFHPSGSLKDALEKASDAFFSEITRFVTNGTTGANSIVYRAILRPGDVVVLDRNCHKSHHYAAVQAGAFVVYMEPMHVHDLGISSVVPHKRIIDVVRKTYEHWGHRLRMVALTHPTFDGLLYSPELIIREIAAIDKDIVILFDEAWFAYGVFHNRFMSRTAMASAAKLREEGVDARVYATQSIHKTLSAMRQGSMIHIRDPHLRKGDKLFSLQLENAFEESFISQTTTSPNVHILASLDMARMQAQMEGHDRLQRAIEIADWIREELRVGPVRVLGKEHLLPEGLDTSNSEYALDPLKITLHFEGVAGSEFREKQLYRRFGIQVNKYSHNTVLVLVTIGTTLSMADRLVRRLKKWTPFAYVDFQEGAQELKIPEFSQFGTMYTAELDGAARATGYPVGWHPGDISKAYYDGFDKAEPEHREGKSVYVELPKMGEDVSQLVGRISLTFISPYPPGYPILVPGQVISEDCVRYLQSLLARKVKVSDIHGLVLNENSGRPMLNVLYEAGVHSHG